MPAHRTPNAKAEITGSALKHPGRFAGRSAPKRIRPIGAPYASMTDIECRYWDEFKAELPWLHSGHRVVLRLACRFSARLEIDPDFGVSAAQALSSLLSKLGATPVDETKVAHPDADDDADDEFFGRPN